MKKIFVLVAGLFFCTLLANAQNNVIDSELQSILNQKNDDYIDVNIILKSQMSKEDFQALNCKSDSKEVRRELMINELKKHSQKTQENVLSFLNAEEISNNVIEVKSYWLTNFINCKARRDIIYQLASHPDVASIVYNGEMEVVSDIVSENDTRGIQSSAEIAQHLTQIKADKAWELGYTGKGVIVAVLDSGVNTEHADLKDHLWNGNAQHGYNVVSPGQKPIDDRSHGTHCAGIVCGDGTSGKTTGAAPEATLMSIKLYDANSGLTIQRLTSGIEFAIENGADILSISQGWINQSASNRSTLRNTFDNVLNLGIVAAVACGNDRQSLGTYPAPYNVRTPGDCPPPWLHPDQTLKGGLSSVVSVGAVDYNNVVSGISSQGPVSWEGTSYNDYPYAPEMGLIRPDICAPGNNIVSLDNESNNSYTIKAGTSMAAPSVAGVMALMLEKNNELTPADLCRIIETTATKVSEKKNNDTGSGVINALAAVQAVDFNTTGPYINKHSFTSNFIPGTNLNLELTLVNNGKGSTSGNTNVSISTNDSYVSIVDGNESYGVMAANQTATATFMISIDKLSPDNHKATLNVNATNGSHNRSFDIVINVSNVLLPPANVTAVAEDTFISLSWDEANNATSYNIYRNETFLANVNSTSYLDEGLEYGTLYSYTLTSKRGELESEHSQILRVQTDDDSNAPAPTNVTANVVEDNVSISWVNGNDSKTSNVYRKDMTSGEETKIASNINGNTYTDNSWNTLQDGVYKFGVTNIYSQEGTIYEEGFESISANNSYNANNSDWYYYNENGAKYNWVIAESISTGMVNNPTIFTPYLGNKAAFITSNYNNPSYLTYLVTQEMDYTQYDGNNISFSFYYITPAWGTDINTLKVMASTTSHNSGWTELWSSKKTDVTEWTKVTVDLSDYVGKKFFIAFVNIAGYGLCSGVDEVAISGNGSKESRIEWSENIYKNPNTFVQDGLWNDAENWSKKQVADINEPHIIINANATIDKGDIMVNSLEIANGSLTLNDGVTLSVNKDFINADADALIINDGAQVFQSSDNVAATFVMNIINPDKWSSENIDGWQFIASPIKNADMEAFIPKSSDYDLYKYNGSNDLEWLNHKGGQFETTFQQGQGYLASYESETQAVFKGILCNDRNYEFILSYESSKDLANFHLLGNPFSFDMNWDNIQSDNIANGYAFVNADGGYEYATSGIIKTGDGFFVKTISNNPSLTYNNTKQRNDKTGRSINMTASGNSGKDNLIICISDEVKEGFTKLNNFNKSIANVYVSENNKHYGIYNCNEDTKEVNVNFEAKEMGNYTIHIEREGEFETIILVDKVTGDETDMLQNDYTFTATAQENNNRFVVRFVKGDGLNENYCDIKFVYQSGSELIINGEGHLQIIDLMGRVIYNNEVANDNNRIDINRFNNATYIIRMINEECVKTQKITVY